MNAQRVAVGCSGWLDVSASQTISANCAPDVKPENDNDGQRQDKVNSEHHKPLPHWFACEECKCAADGTAQQKQISGEGSAMRLACDEAEKCDSDDGRDSSPSD